MQLVRESQSEGQAEEPAESVEQQPLRDLGQNAIGYISDLPQPARQTTSGMAD